MRELNFHIAGPLKHDSRGNTVHVSYVTKLEIRDSQNLAKLGLGGQLIFILMICEVVTQ